MEKELTLLLKSINHFIEDVSLSLLYSRIKMRIYYLHIKKLSSPESLCKYAFMLLIFDPPIHLLFTHKIQIPLCTYGKQIFS